MEKELEELQRIAMLLCTDKASPSDGLDMMLALSELRVKIILQTNELDRILRGRR